MGLSVTISSFPVRFRVTCCLTSPLPKGVWVLTIISYLPSGQGGTRNLASTMPSRSERPLKSVAGRRPLRCRVTFTRASGMGLEATSPVTPRVTMRSEARVSGTKLRSPTT